MGFGMVLASTAITYIYVAEIFFVPVFYSILCCFGLLLRTLVPYYTVVCIICGPIATHYRTLDVQITNEKARTRTNPYAPSSTYHNGQIFYFGDSTTTRSDLGAIYSDTDISGNEAFFCAAPMMSTSILYTNQSITFWAVSKSAIVLEGQALPCPIPSCEVDCIGLRYNPHVGTGSFDSVPEYMAVKQAATEHELNFSTQPRPILVTLKTQQEIDEMMRGIGYFVTIGVCIGLTGLVFLSWLGICMWTSASLPKDSGGSYNAI